MKKKTNNKKSLVIVAAVLGALLLLLVAVLIGVKTLGSSGEETPETTTTAPSSVEDLIISTAFCDLKFPGKWEQQLRAEYTESDNGGAVTFRAQIGEKKAELFTVLFSSHIDTDCSPVGVLTGEEPLVMVSLKLYDPESQASWDAGELEMVFAMQDECNYLTDQLRLLPNFDPNYEPYFAPEDGQIETPFCTLSYPGAWTDRIWWEFTPADNGGTLAVYGIAATEEALLFTMSFGPLTEEAAPVGKLKVGGGSVDVGLTMAEPEDSSSWTSADWDDYAAMQEIVNDLLASLMENPDFTAI